MADLTKPMSAAAIKKLDYFEKAQLYHNVYSKYAYKDLPYELKTFYDTDNGLKAIQAIASTGSIQDPYTLVHLLRVLMPEMPKSYQHIYKRAEFLADMCDTSVENILRSRLFLAENFIPDMVTGEIDKIIKTKGTGTYIPIEEGSYTPDPDAGKGGGSGGGGEGEAEHVLVHLGAVEPAHLERDLLQRGGAEAPYLDGLRLVEVGDAAGVGLHARGGGEDDGYVG